jgi:hypothetical protein
MVALTMMDFFTRSLKKNWVDAWLAALAFIGVMYLAPAWGQTVGEINQLRVERVDDDIVLSAQMQFDLPAAVEEVITKGVPVTFTAEAEIYRSRWYWFDKRLSFAQRSYRLAFQPLSRRWRVTVGSPSSDTGAALSMSQVFDSLAEALGHIKRIARWRVADAQSLDTSLSYRAEFRYRLDVSQLALPLQIGTLGQSDWNVTLSASVPFSAEIAR